jgi:NAD(P)-dependent dehydrogenase (short-subunit alcohol dehydrogenase family)
MNTLQGKVALVTGASRGIGRAIAQRFAAEGATVVITARSLHTAALEGTLSETAKLIDAAGGHAIALAADLENPTERDALVERAVAVAGGLDILVNNAGYAEYAPVANMQFNLFERTVDHYLRAPFALIQRALPHMGQHGGGWILNIGSVTAEPPQRPFDDFARFGGATVYAAVKAAMHRFTEGLAAELQNENIAVNLVGPSGAIRTPGASRYIPADYPTEPVEYLVETALALCHKPAAEVTGEIAYSMAYPAAHKLTVYQLDGRTSLVR